MAKPKARAKDAEGAYVKFCVDNEKCIVKTSDIKKFESKYHKRAKVYMVKWTLPAGRLSLKIKNYNIINIYCFLCQVHEE